MLSGTILGKEPVWLRLIIWADSPSLSLLLVELSLLWRQWHSINFFWYRIPTSLRPVADSSIVVADIDTPGLVYSMVLRKLRELIHAPYIVLGELQSLLGRVQRALVDSDYARVVRLVQYHEVGLILADANKILGEVLDKYVSSVKVWSPY